MNIGSMKFGGMTPAEAFYELPHGYVFFCCHKEKNGEVLTWLTQDTILFNGNVYDLKFQPSYRNNWCTFII